MLVIVPVTLSTAQMIIPAPDKVLEAPLIWMVPALAIKLPLTDKLPVRLKEIAVVTVPLTVKLSSEMPVPLMVVPLPLIVKMPPDAWLKEPEPVVARLPVNVTAALEKLTDDAATVRLLKFSAPVPLMRAPEPVKITVLVLPVNVPLLTQLPPTLSR